MEVSNSNSDDIIKASDTERPPFTPQPNWTLISQGAEARIWKIPPSEKDPSEIALIAKERFSKSYRHPVLDEKLTKARCRAEGRILEKCHAHNTTTNNNTVQSHQKIGVPRVIRIEAPVLYLEYVEGMTVRTYVEELLLVGRDSHCDAVDTDATGTAPSLSEETLQLAKQIGSIVGTLHSIGCIHGDLTTSNMMLRPDPTLPATKRIKPADTDSADKSVNGPDMLLIDFGLAKNTTSAEERAVDLYVLERALTSTHPHLPAPTFFVTVLEAYKTSLLQQMVSQENDKNKGKSIKAVEATLSRLEQVRLRGRKRECFG